MSCYRVPRNIENQLHCNNLINANMLVNKAFIRIRQVICYIYIYIHSYSCALLMGEGMAKSGLAFPDAGFPEPNIGYIYLEWND